MLIVLGLDRNRGGLGPSLFSYHKATGETRNLGPLFETADPLSWATGEGWYFSGTRPSALYINDDPRMVRYDVISQASETVYDVRDLVYRKENLSTANNGLLKISGCDGCPDATAVSNETIGSVGWE